jgi:hypothetical protein
MLELVILFLSPFLVISDPLPYAEWAHYHMVWLSDNHSNQKDIQTIFDDYVSHDIQFGTVNIDSQ